MKTMCGRNVLLTIPRVVSLLLIFFILLLANGCVVKDIGQTMEQTVKGDYFLKSEKYEQGRESFEQEVRENPESALANYYYGRFLLQDNENKEALVHLKKARDLKPDNPDYAFWAGVASGEQGDKKSEENNYRKALSLDKNHLQSLIYLGHTLLGKKKYEEALSFYSRALEIWPGSPSALYNRGLILNKLGRTPEERLAWLEYCSCCPSGTMAIRAASHLNRTGDFSFRNHKLGTRTVTTEKIRFTPFGATLSETSSESLILIGSIFSTMEKGTLQIVMYQKNNKKLARDRAHAIKRYLLAEFPEIKSEKIGISWFAVPQSLSIMGKKLVIDESVSFFVSKGK